MNDLYLQDVSYKHWNVPNGKEHTSNVLAFLWVPTLPSFKTYNAVVWYLVSNNFCCLRFQGRRWRPVALQHLPSRRQ